MALMLGCPAFAIYMCARAVFIQRTAILSPFVILGSTSAYL